MGKKSKPPKGPDWNRLLDMSAQYQQQNQALFDEFMEFQKGAYGEQKAIQDQILGVQLPAMRDEAALSQQLRDRYREMGIPFENEYFDKLTTWDTEQRRNERAGEAQAQIGQAAEAQREAELRRLESYGIDPSQTRSAALDSQLRLQEAVARAAAGNQQRRAVEQEGIQFGAGAIDLMRGGLGASTQALQNATGAGQAAFGNQQSLGGFGQAGYGQGANMIGQGSNILNQGYGTAGNLYQGDLARYELKQKNSPLGGIGNLLGTALGAAGAVGGFGPLFGFMAEGGPVDGGGAQPAAAPRNPQSGIPADNVPKMMSPGEFVIPDDVARWEGEKNLQKLINKARQDKANTDAQRAQNQRGMGIPA